MNETDDLLFELGTEELPPKQLAKLATALADHIQTGIEQVELSFESIKWFATPRRLAVIISQLQTQQVSRQEQRRGPALAAAYDDAGKPTKAAEGFAKSCKTSVDQLETLETDKGTWLSYNVNIEGKAAVDLIPDIIRTALQKLPIAKRMRWGNSNTEFVRPVHWAVLILGEKLIQTEILGCQSSNQSIGHRFHAPAAITIKKPSDYQTTLQESAFVLVDYQQRKKTIEDSIIEKATELNAKAIIDPDLLDEVTSINEWPVVVMGGFDPVYLELPKEVLIASMQDHQKYFPLMNDQGELLPHFITFANIDSKNIDTVRKGNERVLSPRLNDARFFWQQDNKLELADYQTRLKSLLYQKQLGTMAEKTQRVTNLAAAIADSLSVESTHVCRAANLAKCDLVTDMVGEFPELQGTIGYYYALKNGEDEQVAIAVDEQYKPRYSGDTLPETETGQIVSLAEKIETIVGIFSIDQIPTGDKDPFALKRAALGALRIMIECKLDLDLHSLITSVSQQYTHKYDKEQCINKVFDFMMERLRGYYQDNAVDTLTFESVLARRPSSPLDFHQRIEAVKAFQKLPEATDLAAANKRISNILKKNNETLPASIDKKLLEEKAERELAEKLIDIQQTLDPLFSNKHYSAALTELATLRDSIDTFFDQVMVMTDDLAIKLNRLCLLQSVNELFLVIADISKLQTS